MKRRNVIKAMTLLPLADGVLPFKSVVGAPTNDITEGKKVEPNIFRSIGVEPVINCMGTFTIIGGSLERPPVRAAMEAASKNFIQYDELAEGIGRRMAQLTGAEWGMVSAGCAAGLKHVTAACVTGGNPEKLIRIPDLTGFDKTEVVIPVTSRNAYDHAIRNKGVKVIDVRTMNELEQAINPQTAMIYVLSGSREPFTVSAIAKVAKAKNVPLLVDAAAEDLTVPNIHLQNGATVVAYSGGKALCGPQCAGILLGQKDLLQSAWQASSPHHGPGRDNKVGREEMMGALAAVEAWISHDHKAQWKTWLSYLDTISQKVTKINGVTTRVHEPEGYDNHSPVLLVMWDPDKLHITGEEVAEELGRNKPRIALAAGWGNKDDMTSIRITAGQMQPGEDKIVADRIAEVLSRKRSPRSKTMAAPAASIAGKWDIEIAFYSSKSQYSWILEQEDNWLQGSHTGELSQTRSMNGTIEGDQVKIRTTTAIPGDHVTFLYTGALSGDQITGSVYMVEYGTAKFTAKKNKKKADRRKINVPGGPPLAT